MYFLLFGLGETEAYLHADNCVGQNNDHVFFYCLAWRGLHKWGYIKKSHTPSYHRDTPTFWHNQKQIQNSKCRHNKRTF